MKLSEEEKKVILEMRKKKEDDKPKKIGFLKEDLFTISPNEDAHIFSNWILSREEKQKEIDEFINNFQLACPAGTKFVCFIDDGNESWFDDINYGIENMDNDWANKYLKDIKFIK